MHPFFHPRLCQHHATRYTKIVYVFQEKDGLHFSILKIEIHLSTSSEIFSVSEVYFLYNLSILHATIIKVESYKKDFLNKCTVSRRVNMMKGDERKRDQ